ncbi:MAG: DNA-binding transcription factor yap1 [Thelocarpon superellum]|nr:MAG: DNA-binding transcription factor yap1 [Thelocarpon superellum]
MATFSDDSTSALPDLYLSADQQELLLAALSSNNPNTATTLPGSSNAGQRPALGTTPRQLPQSAQNPSTSMESSGLFQSPPSENMGLPYLEGIGPEDSPALDYDLDFDIDGSFDVDDSTIQDGQMIGNLPGPSSSAGGGTDGDNDAETNETNDKRKSPDDDKATEDGNGGGGKRREGDDKTAKKPGRKPLTSEPTSKRKAQNRAAQRAFRDRKEKHLKDLEMKVSDLEKASESANQENGLLRAQVERLNNELKDYRKRLSATGPANLNRSPPNNALTTFLNRQSQGVNPDSAFQFDFPRFGNLPGSHIFNNGSLAQRDDRQAAVSPSTAAATGTNGVSRGSVGDLESPKGSDYNAGESPANLSTAESLSGLFSPSILQTVTKSSSAEFPFASAPTTTSPRTGQSPQNGSGSLNSNTASSQYHAGSNASSTTSPSASSVSHKGSGSSCGTSPEPSNCSPVTGKLPDQLLGTISEEHSHSAETFTSNPWVPNLTDGGNPRDANSRNTSENSVLSSATLSTPGSDLNGIDWLAQQNGGQFDPVLFGDYREPQDAITSGEYDSYFNEAFPLPDLSAPFSDTLLANFSPNANAIPVNAADKAQERERKAQDKSAHEPLQSPVTAINKAWDMMKSGDQKVRCGEFEIDIDSLCSDMRKKAKCSETGLYFDQEDADIMLARLAKQKKMPQA